MCRDGKHYCKQHDPIARQQKADRRYEKVKAKWEAEAKAREWNQKCIDACTGMSDPDKEIKALREVVNACEKLRSQWTPQHVATTALDFAVVDVILALAALKAEGEVKNG